MSNPLQTGPAMVQPEQYRHSVEQWYPLVYFLQFDGGQYQ